jgi:3-oxoacyl-[acyl-carrier protein] reductase
MTSPHVLVIGGSRGLGKGFAALARESGWRVSVVARTTPQPSTPGFYAFDLCNVAGIGELLARIVAEQGPLQHMVFFQRFRGSGDDWTGEIAASLGATKCFLENSVSAFEPTQKCSAVLVSSVNAFYISPKLPCSYHVGKAGLAQLARYFAVSLGAQGIRVNAVCPATFIKPENEGFYAENRETYQRLAQASPLQRMGSYRDVADAIFFLLSDKASFITGQSLLVDGGISLRWHETLTA